jgi:hypothetical protein
MSDQEPFLSRWSRRKSDAANENDVAQKGVSRPTAPEPAKVAEETNPTPFDPATLPPIESIDALSDVTVFFQKGVPAELTRAALRRVWAADPSIRDFIGLAENAWDFTDPNAMPGFGPLGTGEDVQRMIAEVVDQVGKAARQGAPDQPGQYRVAENANVPSAMETQRVDVPEVAEATLQVGGEGASVETAGGLLQSSNESVAAQENESVLEQEEEKTAQKNQKRMAHRGHGGALPR